MNRVTLAGCIVLSSTLLLTACLPSLPDPLHLNPSSPSPLPGQPTATVAISTSIESSATTTPSTEPSATPSLIPTGTFTPIPSFTSTIVTTEINSPTTTDTAVPNGSGTTIPNPSGTLAPNPAETTSPNGLTVIVVTDTAVFPRNKNTVYMPAHIQNNSKTQADISLQCTTIKGQQITIEYNNFRNVSTMLPQGNYVYVAYVGGKQIIGSFSFLIAQKLLISIYKDRVVIQ